MEYTRGMVGINATLLRGGIRVGDDELGNRGSQALASIKREENIVINDDGEILYVPFHSIVKAVVATEEETLTKSDPYGCGSELTCTTFYSNEQGSSGMDVGTEWMYQNSATFIDAKVGDVMELLFADGTTIRQEVYEVTENAWRAKTEGLTDNSFLQKSEQEFAQFMVFIPKTGDTAPLLTEAKLCTM